MTEPVFDDVLRALLNTQNGPQRVIKNTMCTMSPQERIATMASVAADTGLIPELMKLLMTSAMTSQLSHAEVLSTSMLSEQRHPTTAPPPLRLHTAPLPAVGTTVASWDNPRWEQYPNAEQNQKQPNVLQLENFSKSPVLSLCRDSSVLVPRAQPKHAVEEQKVVKTSDARQKFACTKCRRSYTSCESLKLHLKLHAPAKCNKFSLEFEDGTNMRFHKH